jgi:type IV fimbrial biogenesis protein FimT
VFVDANNNAIVDGGEEIVQNQQLFNPAIQITGDLPLSNNISYKGSGTNAQFSGAFQAGTITACNVSKGAATAQKISVSGVGKVRQSRGKVPSCLSDVTAIG